MQYKKPIFIIFSGLPGCGKTTLAKRVSDELGAVYLRIDSIEKGIIASEYLNISEVEDTGYLVGYAVAKDNLSLGNSVVADSVNSIKITRDDWLKVAQGLNVDVKEVEVICSDMNEHRKRLETRPENIPNRKNPTWDEVIERECDEWEREHIIIDTAHRTIDESFNQLLLQI